ncbi:hypothetical protein KPH14_012773, partial [Odynerus spinipes]
LVEVKCLKTKAAVKDVIKEYIARIERQTGKKVKRFRTDNGLEYCNEELTTFFNKLGIKHERSNVETPQMNGVAERVNRTLLNLTRAMLKSSGLPQKFWAEAVTTAAYIKNRVGHSATQGVVPLTMWIDRKPSVKHLKIYGCLAYARIPDQGRRKLDDRADECIFVGYATQTRGYRLWCPRRQDVITTKHVRFAEDKSGYEWIHKKHVENFRYNEIWERDSEPEEIDKVLDTPEDDAPTIDIDRKREQATQQEIVGAQDANMPKRRGRPVKIIRNPYGRKGKPKSSSDKEQITTDNEDGNTTGSEFEANLVEIIEPRDLKEALSSPQAEEWKEEEIYMRPPPLYKTDEGNVLRLLRPIYGLKQSGRNWNEEIDNFLASQGFKRLKTSNCVYKRDDWTIVVVYVDDLFLFAPDLKLIESAVRHITSRYEAKDLGEINQALGIKVERKGNGDIRLSQKKYIEELLKRFGMVDCRKAATPLDPSIRLSKEDAPTNERERFSMRNVPYRELIGGLMFLAQSTRPDVLYAVIKLSQYNSNPGKRHWDQAKHILRYLNGTRDYSITYRACNKPRIEVYCDADWAGDLDDRHSYSGMVLLIGNDPVQWKSSKQKSLSTSTMEAEYVSLANGTKEILWLSMFFKELDLTKFVPGTIKMNCDNRAAIDFSKNRVEKSRTKHIDVAYHLVRENLEKGLMHLSYVPSNENLADGMTKGLKKIAHERFAKALGLGIAKWGN